MSSETHKVEHVILELHPNEVELLNLIRHTVRFGVLTIQVKDGVPIYADEIIKRHSLTPVDK